MTAVAAGGEHTAAGYRKVSELTTTATLYSYDRLYRLTGADDGTATGYAYDPAGNRTSKDATGYSYDRADRIETAGGVSYQVDEAGNLVARGGDSFTYDQANRLKGFGVLDPLGNPVSGSLSHDGDGRRARKELGSTTVTYCYDINRPLPVLLEDGERRYVWGLGLAYAVDIGQLEVAGSPWPDRALRVTPT